MFDSEKNRIISELTEMVRKKNVGLELKYESYSPFCSNNYVRFRVQSDYRDNNGNTHKRYDSDELFDYLKDFVTLLEINKDKFHVSFYKHVWYGSDGYSYYHTCYIRNSMRFSDPDRNLDQIDLLGYRLLKIHNKLRDIRNSAECKAIHVKLEIDSLNNVIDMVGASRKIQNKLKDKEQEQDKIIYEYYDEVIEKQKIIWQLKE
jgi:hypothetical protein